MRVRKCLLEFHQLRVREGSAISSLLPARIVIQARYLSCATVVLSEVTSMMRLTSVMAAMIER